MIILMNVFILVIVKLPIMKQELQQNQDLKLENHDI